MAQKKAGWLHNPCCLGGPQRFRAGGRIRSGPQVGGVVKISHLVFRGGLFDTRKKIFFVYFFSSVTRVTRVTLEKIYTFALHVLYFFYARVTLHPPPPPRELACVAELGILLGPIGPPEKNSVHTLSASSMHNDTTCCFPGLCSVMGGH